MVDREKVIKALECRKNVDKRCGNPCEDTGLCHYATAVRCLDGEIYKPFICDRERICADAITLLKEQKKQKFIVDSDGKITPLQDIVRCKDCKHLEHLAWLDEKNGKECYVCRKHSFTGMRSPDWFCADGEMKSAE